MPNKLVLVETVVTIAVCTQEVDALLRHYVLHARYLSLAVRPVPAVIQIQIVQAIEVQHVLDPALWRADIGVKAHRVGQKLLAVARSRRQRYRAQRRCKKQLVELVCSPRPWPSLGSAPATDTRPDGAWYGPQGMTDEEE
jgi:hypothetical protein